MSMEIAEYEVIEIEKITEEMLYAKIRDNIRGEFFMVQAFKEDGKWRAKYEETPTGISLDIYDEEIDEAIERAMKQGIGGEE